MRIRVLSIAMYLCITANKLRGVSILRVLKKSEKIMKFKIIVKIFKSCKDEHFKKNKVKKFFFNRICFLLRIEIEASS